MTKTKGMEKIRVQNWKFWVQNGDISGGETSKKGHRKFVVPGDAILQKSPAIA